MLALLALATAGAASGPRGLCVFDVDKTLTRGVGATAGACCERGANCLEAQPYTTYCAGEHPSPDDEPRLYECRPSCKCGSPGCEYRGQCPFFNSTAITPSTNRPCASHQNRGPSHRHTR